MAAYQDRDFNPGPFCPGKAVTIKDDEIEQFNCNPSGLLYFFNKESIQWLKTKLAFSALMVHYYN